ncbi:MAG TPA: amino acid adenylation domain-containing protein [Herpetosiphonaceae bacterium]
MLHGQAPEQAPRGVFLLPGLGEPHLGMGRDLYQHEPVFRAALDHGATVAQPLLGIDLRALLYPTMESDGQPEKTEASASGTGRPTIDLRRLLGRTEETPTQQLLDDPAVAHAALFVVEYALAQLWQSWGTPPQAMLGYSLGEYVAACLAGVFTFEDALTLVVHRARLIDSLPRGAMLAVPLAAETLRPLLHDDLAIAALNGPHLCVVAGSSETVATLAEALREQGVASRRLATTHALHSPLMGPIVAAFRALVAQTPRLAPQIPYLSNLTGTWITAEQATDPGYWARHLCEPVQLAQALATLLSEQPQALVEVGPGSSLSSAALQVSASRERVVVSSLPPAASEGNALAHILVSLGQLWLTGVVVSWHQLSAPEPRRRVPLPTYPFERRRFWIDPITWDATRQDETEAPTSELAFMQHARPNLANAYVAPETPLQSSLSAVWSELLGIEPIGTHDNFFAMGGHSLIATQIVTAIRDQYHVDLPLRALFEAPTVAELAALVEQAQHLATEQQAPPLVRVPRDGVLPLAFAQERLWFLDQLVPNNPAYHIPAAVRLEGTLVVWALEATLNQISQRHEPLRTTFALIDGQPAQIIAPALSLRLSIIDLQMLPDSAQEPELARLITAEAQRPFDLTNGPLLRGTLFKLAPHAHALLLTMHHIIADGWSGGVLVQEIATLYPAWVAGDADAGARRLPELPIQYADYAVWQRRWMHGVLLEEQLAYWKRQLAGVPVLTLPSDRPRPAVQTFRGATQRFLLPPQLADALTSLSQQEDVTLFMTLLAAFQVLLARYTSQDDIAVGTPVANRTRAELEPLIGCFVNMVVLRTDLGGNPSFRELLQRVRQVALGAYSHQEVPFEHVVNAVQPSRDLSHTPLFQVVFILQNTPMPLLELPDLRLREQPVKSGTIQFDLEVNLVETADGINGWLDYNTDLFEATTMARLIAHFEALLAAVVAQPERRIAEISLLTAAEQQLLLDWNTTADSYPADRCVHQLIERQAAQNPAAIAVVDGLDVLTYRELNRRANQVAHYLCLAGVRPEAYVAVCLERSADFIVGVLAILKAGAAYIPLDPASPPARLQLMLEDTRVPVVLTHSSLIAQLPPSLTQMVCLDAERPAIMRQPETNPAQPVSVDQLAYVIYTSGSTGRPKGVQIEHRGLLNLVFWHQRAFHLSPRDRTTQIAGLAFDASVWEIWPYLAAGATIVLPDAGTTWSPTRLRDWLLDQAITVAFLPTPLAEQIITLAWPEESALRILLTGGDQLHGYPAPALPFTLVNNYGPTENTVVTTSGTVPPLEAAERAPDLGRPIANVQVYILDQRLQPQPAGVPGELYVGGSSLARGYLNRPNLTAERFIPHPFTKIPGARLYRTGDLARYRTDGTLEFLGRNDAQIKLRGFRIELGEIETVLNAHPQIRQSVVLACEDQEHVRSLPSGQPMKRLVAYIVANQEPEANQAATADPEMGSEIVQGVPALNPADLRQYAAARLPDYMVPSTFISLDVLPLTPNGKVDRRALPTPGSAPEARLFVPPATKIEHDLAGIWADLLGVERVGIHDNFFALGGDSILSMQVIARATQKGWHLTPRQIFQHQTIAELAAATGAAQPTVEPALVVGDVPLTPIQHWFFEQPISAPQHWNLALLLEVPPMLDTERLAEALQHLMLHHDALRLRFFWEPDGWRQTTGSTEARIPCRVLDLALLAPAEQRETIEAYAAEIQRSLDLAVGPVVQVAHFSRGPQQSGRLLIVAHHLVIDGVSWRILLHDLQTAYQQLSSGATVHLPPKTTSYQQWAQHLQAYAQTPELWAEWAYWRDALPTKVAPLPCDDLDGQNSEGSAALITRWLAAEKTQALLHDVHQAYQTRIDDMLLTAMLLTLSPWIGDSAVLVDLDRHGRVDLFPQVDLSRTVGWFTTIVPVLLRVESPTSIEGGLQAVKAQLQQIPRSGIGYGVLRHLHSRAEIAEHLRSLPQSEINFNYLGQIDQSLGGPLILSLIHDSVGPTRSPESTRRYVIEINAVIVDGQLQMTWVYSTQRHMPATIEQLADTFMHTVQLILDHCLAIQNIS